MTEVAVRQHQAKSASATWLTCEALPNNVHETFNLSIHLDAAMFLLHKKSFVYPCLRNCTHGFNMVLDRNASGPPDRISAVLHCQPTISSTGDIVSQHMIRSRGCVDMRRDGVGGAVDPLPLYEDV
jgi:hypothetical protein